MKSALRAAQWVVAIIVALPLLPFAMAICAGASVAARARDKGNRTRRGGIIGGVVGLLIFLLLVGIGILVFWLVRGT
jgi:hypothetical protein